MPTLLPTIVPLLPAFYNVRPSHMFNGDDNDKNNNITVIMTMIIIIMRVMSTRYKSIKSLK